MIAGILESDDAIEGMLSFMQKRDPAWTGTVPKDIPDWLPWRS